MRICISAFLVSTRDGVKKAGVGRAMYSLLGELVRDTRGHQLEIFLCDDVDLPNDWLSASNVNWHRISISGMKQRVWWEHYKVGKEAKRLKCDALLSLFLPLPFFCNLPKFTIAHDAFPRTHAEWYPLRKRFILDNLTKYACRKSCRVLTVSEFSKKELARAYGKALQEIIVISNGPGNDVRPLNESELAEVDWSKFPAGPTIFSVSTLEPRKNMEGLIRSFDLVADEYPDHQLLIAGAKGWLDSPIVKVLESCKHPDRIHLLGYVSDLELNALIQKADLFTLVSFVEGFGLPVLEAMIVGTPVLTSNTSSLPEVAAEYAFYCHPASHESIANGLRQALSDQEERETKAASAKLRAELFTWKAVADRVENAIQNAVN